MPRIIQGLGELHRELRGHQWGGARHRIGVDHIMVEVDYPHADSTFPHSEDTAARICEKAGLSDEETAVVAVVRVAPVLSTAIAVMA